MLQGSLNPSQAEPPRWSNQCPVSQMEKPKQSPNVLPNHICYVPNQVSVLNLVKQAQAPPCRARSSFRSPQPSIWSSFLNSLTPRLWGLQSDSQRVSKPTETFLTLCQRLLARPATLRMLQGPTRTSLLRGGSPGTLSRSLLYPKVSSNTVSQGTSTSQNSP